MIRKYLCPAVLAVELLFMAGMAHASDRDPLKKAALERTGQLEKIIDEMTEQLRKKRFELRNIAEEIGYPEPGTVSLQQKSALEYHTSLRRELSEVQRQILTLEAESNSRRTPDSPEVNTEEQIEQKEKAVSDSQVGVLPASSPATTSQLEKLPPVDQAMAKVLLELKALREELSQSRKEVARLSRQVERLGNEKGRLASSKLEILQRQKLYLIEEMKQVQREVKQGGVVSLDIEMKRKDIERIEQVLDRLHQEYERTRAEVRELDEAAGKN